MIVVKFHYIVDGILAPFVSLVKHLVTNVIKKINHKGTKVSQKTQKIKF